MGATMSGLTLTTVLSKNTLPGFFHVGDHIVNKQVKNPGADFLRQTIRVIKGRLCKTDVMMTQFLEKEKESESSGKKYLETWANGKIKPWWEGMDSRLMKYKAAIRDKYRQEKITVSDERIYNEVLEILSRNHPFTYQQLDEYFKKKAKFEQALDTIKTTLDDSESRNSVALQLKETLDKLLIEYFDKTKEHARTMNDYEVCLEEANTGNRLPFGPIAIEAIKEFKPEFDDDEKYPKSEATSHKKFDLKKTRYISIDDYFHSSPNTTKLLAADDKRFSIIDDKEKAEKLILYLTTEVFVSCRAAIGGLSSFLSQVSPKEIDTYSYDPDVEYMQQVVSGFKTTLSSQNEGEVIRRRQTLGLGTSWQNLLDIYLYSLYKMMKDIEVIYELNQKHFDKKSQSAFQIGLGKVSVNIKTFLQQSITTILNPPSKKRRHASVPAKLKGSSTTNDRSSKHSSRRSRKGKERSYKKK